ncbi:MAG TPA: hypothetical protein VFQ44_17420 [Streptosporangiaceae bacterium]|nr:hypothetical protein [Streptosporangiaceae bacterium]
MIAGNEHTVVLLTIWASIAGRDLAGKAVHVCHVRHGKVSEVWALHWDQAAMDDAMTEVIVWSARKHSTAGGAVTKDRASHGWSDIF